MLVVQELLLKLCNTKSLGIDISSNQINYANGNYSSEGEFLTLNKFAIEYYEGKFDCITVLGLFEYLENNEIPVYFEILIY